MYATACVSTVMDRLFLRRFACLIFSLSNVYLFYTFGLKPIKNILNIKDVMQTPTYKKSSFLFLLIKEEEEEDKNIYLCFFKVSRFNTMKL